MLFVWIALWAVGLFLLANDPRSASIRWLALLAASGGAGALAVTLDERFIPWIAGWEPALYRLQATSSLVSYYGVPYAFAMYALAFRPIAAIPAVWRRWLPALLLVPVALFLLATPPYNETYPITYRAVVWWAVPLMLAGAANILVQRPRHPSHWAAYSVACLAVLVPAMMAMVLSYVLPSLGFLRTWVYNTWFVGAGVALFVTGLFTYGFMGMRLLIESRRLDTAFRAVTSGTALLNHAMKNDAAKMRLFGQRIRENAEASGDKTLLADIDVVLTAAAHMQEMIARVHRKTEELTLQPAATDMERLIRGVLDGLAPRLQGITLRVSLAAGWRCTLDPAQTAEALGNIVANAVEAMRGQGELTVEWTAGKKELLLEIGDSGPGMDAAGLRRAMDPFYTTKAGGGANFGLGLPYAYQVMRKHGGSLHLRSKPGTGTRVTLVFPKRSVRAELGTAKRITEG